MKHKDSFLRYVQKEFRITVLTKYDCSQQQIYWGKWKINSKIQILVFLGYSKFKCWCHSKLPDLLCINCYPL